MSGLDVVSLVVGLDVVDLVVSLVVVVLVVVGFDMLGLMLTVRADKRLL